ncbi:MAG TPA: M23 family metallopeptidase, partial [Candidatus Fimimonas merdipullorum]|nr:M23 family metallopeptidase [Candidatus Fimimonas merdipullorum]
MNSTPNKFTRFLKNNAALLLIIFCVLAIAAVVLAVTLTDGGNNVLPDDDVVINPNPDEPDEEKPTVSKVYFASPVDYTVVTMDYTDGEDVLFVFNKTLNNWSTHFALDLAAAEGTDVLSMYDGTVVEVSESYGMGNTIKIDHGDNVVATYASLGEV